MKRDHSLDNLAARLRACMAVSPPADGLQGPPGRNPTQNPWSDVEFNRFALELFQLQFDYNQPYRRFCENRSLSPGKVRRWSDIPAVPTAAFKEWELSCLPGNERTTVFFSSGTTEHRPSRHHHTGRSLQVYETSLLQWFKANVRSSFSTALSLTPAQLEAPNSSLVHMFETLRKNRVATNFTFTGSAQAHGAWSVNVAATVQRIEAAIAIQGPTLLLGTAFSYVHLLDGLAERKLSFRLPPGSALMETGGYKGRSRPMPKKELHELLADRLGVPLTQIICEYGMSELSSQAYDQPLSICPQAGDWTASVSTQPARRPFHFPPWARVQIISPEDGREVADGETGLIRVFDLANVYSVMAIQTEDLGGRRLGSFELIGRAILSEPRGCSLMSA
jgi:Acyl-protein synthetase, LuxE